MKNKTTYWWPVFASEKFEKILGAGHAQQETYVVLANSLVVRDPLIFSNLSDAKTGHQYVVLFFELSYNEWTLIRIPVIKCSLKSRNLKEHFNQNLSAKNQNIKLTNHFWFFAFIYLILYHKVNKF